MILLSSPLPLILFLCAAVLLSLGFIFARAEIALHILAGVVTVTGIVCAVLGKVPLREIAVALMCLLLLFLPTQIMTGRRRK